MALPRSNRFCDFNSDPLNAAQVAEFALQDLPGRPKDLQQLSYAHRTNVRQHVQRYEGLRLRHGSGHTLNVSDAIRVSASVLSASRFGHGPACNLGVPTEAFETEFSHGHPMRPAMLTPSETRVLPEQP